MMRPRTLGNTSNFIRQVIDELHSEEWGKKVMLYLADCELHKRGCVLRGKQAPVYQSPPRYRPPAGAAWFETAHSNEVLQQVTAMKSVITSTYGRILKIDSTKKVSHIGCTTIGVCGWLGICVVDGVCYDYIIYFENESCCVTNHTMNMMKHLILYDSSVHFDMQMS